MKCGICGNDDLFSAVTQSPACAVCVIALGLRTPVRQADVDTVRQALGLADGQYRESDPGAEAADIVGRRR